MFLFLSICILAIVLYYYLIRPLQYWPKRGIPQHGIFYSWFKMLKMFYQLKPPAEGFSDIYNSFSGLRYAGIYQLVRPALLIRDPSLIKKITVKDFDHFLDHNQILSSENEILWKKNLFSLQGETWREMRSVLSPSFTSNKMKIMFELICKCAEQVVFYFENQTSKSSSFEFKNIFTRYTNDVIASTAFAVNCDSLKYCENDFYVMGKKATNFGSPKHILLFLAPKLAKYLGIQLFDTELGNFFKTTVKNNIAFREKNELVRPDLIHLLMKARREKIGREDFLTDDDITAQAFGFFLASYDTVSSVMSFLAYELAVNIDVQKRLQTEIDHTLREYEGILTYEALTKMKYMDMVVLEALRKWPPVIATDRVCTKSYTIEATTPEEKSVEIKQGDVIVIPIFSIHRDPNFFPDPKKFDPERFSDSNKSTVNSYAYLSFGIGPRSCIGNRFALLQIKAAFFKILAKFDIITVEKTDIPLQLGHNLITLTAKNGIWLNTKLRNVIST